MTGLLGQPLRLRICSLLHPEIMSYKIDALIKLDVSLVLRLIRSNNSWFLPHLLDARLGDSLLGTIWFIPRSRSQVYLLAGQDCEAAWNGKNAGFGGRIRKRLQEEKRRAKSFAP